MNNIICEYNTCFKKLKRINLYSKTKKFECHHFGGRTHDSSNYCLYLFFKSSSNLYSSIPATINSEFFFSLPYLVLKYRDVSFMFLSYR